ncbi:C2H2-like zinc finger protein [Raphanus sativus]|uniref:Zinc finger protein ZAT1-like n=1 Tax=Raphanus sativus TaxID=3726 RepID=A0A6J0NTN0_RAPSA|nr:zinc finger protein ZAT1-like [Raphanus sativus]KAJ4916597.1 C2H2-like zinc finger protein [Raphanus sativus]
MEKKEFVCKFCNKKFPSGKSLGGHIRIHSPRSSLDLTGKHNNNKKRLVDEREITPPLKQEQQQQCRVCSKRFCSLKALANHMDCHNYAATSSSSGPPTMMIKRSKKQHSNSDESFSIVSSSETVQGAKDLMFLHLGRKDYNFAVDSPVPESSENISELSSGELLTKDKVAAVADDDNSDDGSSDDDYFMNGPKKSVSVGGSLRNTGFNSFSYGDELRKSPAVKRASGANKTSRGRHVCPICFKVYRSGQALGGHKRSHTSTTIANQEERIKHKAAADMQFDLNLPAEEDSDDEE